MLVALASAIVPASSVRAEGAPAGGTASDAAALQKFEEGKKAYDSGQFEQALLAFQASLALLASPNSRLYIARCQRAIGRIASAYVSYKLAAREATDRLNATGEKRYKATRDAATSEMAEIEAKVPRLTLRVPSDVPDDFAITLNGVPVPREAWGTAVETDPGKLEVVAQGKRRKKFVAAFELAEGEQRVLAIHVVRIPSGSLVLKFATKPSGLSVSVDGVALEPTTLDGGRELDIGRHALTVQAPGYVDFRWTGDIRDEEETQVDVVLTAEKRDTVGGVPVWLTVSAGAATVLTLGAGTYFAVRAKSVADEQRAIDPLQRSSDERERVKSLSTTANIFFVAGAALAVGTGVLVYLTPFGAQNKEKATGKAGAWVAVTPNSVLFEGRF